MHIAPYLFYGTNTFLSSVSLQSFFVYSDKLASEVSFLYVYYGHCIYHPSPKLNRFAAPFWGKSGVEARSVAFGGIMIEL